MGVESSGSPSGQLPQHADHGAAVAVLRLDLQIDGRSDRQKLLQLLTGSGPIGGLACLGGNQYKPGGLSGAGSHRPAGSEPAGARGGSSRLGGPGGRDRLCKSVGSKINGAPGSWCRGATQ